MAFEPRVDPMNLRAQSPRVEVGSCVPSCGVTELVAKGRGEEQLVELGTERLGIPDRV